MNVPPAVVRPPEALRVCRCPHCGRVLLEYSAPIQWLRIRCRRCGVFVEFEDVREYAG